MSCDGNNATPPGPAIAPGAEMLDVRRIAESLGERGVDPRLRELVPEFDAPFYQAGLCGYSDAAMRIIARRNGCPFCVTEALLDRSILAGGRGFAKADLGELHDNVPGGTEDHPLSGQIMGSEPTEMAAAALKMAEQRLRSDKAYRLLAYAEQGRFDPRAGGNGHAVASGGGERNATPGSKERRGGMWGGQASWEASSRSQGSVPSMPRSFQTIDVNLACPVKKIQARARGGHWLAEPEGAIAILEAVREAVPREMLTTVKMRRSFDDTPEMAENFERIFDAAYSMGYAWVTVHGRTVQQRYIGPSRWDIVRDIVRRHPNRLIFGSGDIWEAGDIFRMVAYTGVHAVSVARGCIGNPWIFRQARDLMAGKPARPPTIAEQRHVLMEHFELALAVNAGARQPQEFTGRTMRKFGIRFAEHHPSGEHVRKRMILVKGIEDWRRVVEEFYGDDRVSG
ncbi:MAG: tRNA-dihydrouridine synthase family protein [Phycisphaeraceae bacterium]|nr:tRNA-dihydrouridine synthase family protein [Phycisphaeraceae bacterium]MCW5753968.1 tRNA-dihydrouridine synthase family protein [Phycisphaeraceae bacterium]